MNTKEELIQRWDTFLNKMEQRYKESLKQAEDACMDQLQESDYDYYTVFRSWQGMKSQINQLIPKVDETWKQKVEPSMIATDTGNSYFYIDEGHKGSHLTDKLHEEMYRFEAALEGKLSFAYYNYAIQLAKKDFHCSQCSSPIEIQQDVFRAQYVSCSACNSVNTFEPETKLSIIGWNIIDNIVKQRLLPLQEKMNVIQEEIRNVRKDNHTDELWNRYKESYFAYWEAFFKERITLKSTAQERYEADLERKQNEYKEYENVQRYNKYGVK